jgi:hypothetical protein
VAEFIGQDRAAEVSSAITLLVFTQIDASEELNARNPTLYNM